MPDMVLDREGGQQSMLVVDQHISKQLKVLKPLKTDVENLDCDSGLDSPTEKDPKFCDICGTEPLTEDHKASKSHQRAEISLWYNKNK